MSESISHGWNGSGLPTDVPQGNGTWAGVSISGADPGYTNTIRYGQHARWAEPRPVPTVAELAELQTTADDD